jgi:glycosyltransferase involved in cell wall biosynthesis
MGQQPDVSVIIIGHNDAARLPTSVRSVLRQTLRNLEVVIVDDGSTDETPEVVATFCAADDRVRSVRLTRCLSPREEASRHRGLPRAAPRPLEPETRVFESNLGSVDCDSPKTSTSEPGAPTSICGRSRRGP